MKSRFGRRAHGRKKLTTAISAAEITTALRVPNRALRHAQALGRLADGQPFGEPPGRALTLLGREPVWPAWPTLGVHHADDAVGRQLAAVAVERAAVDVQRCAQLLLPRQTKPHQLRHRDALSHTIVLPVDEDGHARGEVRDVTALPDHGHDRVDFLGAGGRRGQMQLRGHRPSRLR